MSNIYEYIKKYAAMLASQEYSAGARARLFVETNEGVFATKKGSNFAELSEDEIEKQTFDALPKGNQAIHSILISQTPYCSEWLKRGKPLIPSLDDMAQIIGTKAAVIDARGGLKAAAPQLARTTKSNAGCFVITAQNADGDFEGFTLTVGRTPYEAIVAMTVLEKSAEVTLLAEKIGSPHHINLIERKLMRTVYLKKYSKSEAEVKAEEAAAESEKAPCTAAASSAVTAALENSAASSPDTAADSASVARTDSAESAQTVSARFTISTVNATAAAGEAPATPASPASAAYEPQDKQSLELSLRAQLVAYGRQLVSCGLVQGTWGNLSARLDETHMLVTPSGLDYMRLTPADMVKVNIDSLEYEGSLKPTSEKGLHAAIYRNRPEIGGIIHTHSKYCSVYAAARTDLPISEENAASDTACCVFTDPVRLAAYALPGTKTLMKNTAAAVGNNYGAIMAGHGMIVCGSELAAAFANARKLEEIAEVTQR